MQPALRIFVCLMVTCSIALAAVPARIIFTPVEKSRCCPKMKAEAMSHDCERHAPKSDDEKQCCAACALGCAILSTPANAFVYPPTGDEKFATFISSEHLRSERPPVPPPRA
jgi:hypothetical protein